MRTLRLMLYSLILPILCEAQTSTIVQPPCTLNFTFNANATSGNLLNQAPSCDKWTMTVYNTPGVSAFSVTLQDAPFATATTPGTFVTYIGTTATGSNPMTATGISTFTNGTAATPFLRLTMSGFTGTGAVIVVLQGTQTLLSKGGGGGGGTSLPIQVNGVAIGTATTLNFQQGENVTQTGAGSGTITVTTNALPEWIDPITSSNASGSATPDHGSVNTATPTALTLGIGTGWSSGMGIQIVGAGVAGANLITTCSTVSGTACTLATGASTTVSGAVVKHDDTAAINAALAITGLVHLRAGTYNVSSPITISAPGQIVGDGQGQTFIQITSATNSTGYFVVNTNISGSTTGQDNLGETIRDMTINMDPTVTPSSGFAIYVTTSGGGGTFVTTMHLNNITINNTYSGLFMGSGAVANWVENMHIRFLQNGGATGQGGIVINSPSPSGDTHWAHDEINGPNTGLLITNADTQGFTDLKVNNTGIVINAASNLSVRRIRFDDSSFEGTNGSGPTCEVSIGANSNTTDQVSFTGGGIGLTPDGICVTNSLALNVANVFFYSTTLQITASGSYGSVIGNTFSSEPSSTTATAVNLTNSSSFIVTDNVIESGAFGVVTDSSIAKIFNLNSNVNKNAVANNLNAATTDFEFLTTPPTCAADGSHALTFPSGSFSCTSITGSGGSAGGGVLGYSGSALTLPTAGTTFLAPVGGALASATEANVTANAPAAAAISMLYVSLSAAPGTGNTITFTYRDAGSSTSLTCTISGASATTCNDTSDSFTPTVGDALSVQVVTTGTVIITPTIKIIAEYGVTAGGGGLTQSGFYLTDGTHFYCASPTVISCVKPVAANWSTTINFGTGVSSSTTGGALGLLTTAAAAVSPYGLATSMGATTVATFLINCYLSSTGSPCGSIGIWDGNTSSSGTHAEAILFAGPGVTFDSTNALIQDLSGTLAFQSNVFNNGGNNLYVNVTQFWARISVVGGTCTYSFSGTGGDFVTYFSHSCPITPSSWIFGVSGPNAEATLLSFSAS